MRPPHAPVAAALPPFPLPLLLLALLLLLSCVPGVVPLVNAQRGPAPGQCLDSVKLKAPLPVPARTKKATDLIVFGDSLSDTGNAFTATGFPAPPFYCSGRRSDGPLWVDGVRDAAGKLLRVQNLAYVGAVLCEQFAAPAFKADNAAAGLLSLEQQVSSSKRVPVHNGLVRCGVLRGTKHNGQGRLHQATCNYGMSTRPSWYALPPPRPPPPAGADVPGQPQGRAAGAQPRQPRRAHMVRA